MAEDIIFPIEDEPTTEVEQYLLPSGTNASVVPKLPALVIGPKVIEILDKKADTPYTGVVTTNKFPEFEVLAQVLEDDNLKVVLKNIKVQVLNPVNLGVISHSSENIDLKLVNTAGNPIAGGMKGVTFGDNVTARQSIVTGTGVVSVTDRNRLSVSGDTEAFADVIPGDILVAYGANAYGDTSWDSTASPLIREFTITEVGDAGADIAISENLVISNNLVFSIVRETSTSVISIDVTDSGATTVSLKGNVDVGEVSFKVNRDIVPSSIVNANQPLISDLVIPSSNFSLETLVDTNDSIKLPANIGVSGFTDFLFSQPGTGALTINTATLTVAGQDLTTGVNAIEIGDSIYFTKDNGVAVQAIVSNIVFGSSNTTITLADTITDSAVTAAIIRSEYKNSTGKSMLVEYADVFVSYRARSVKDVGKLIAISIPSDLDQLGENKPFNIIRVGARAAKANAGLNTVYALITADGSAEAFLEAFERSESKLLYNIVPLTQSLSVHSMGKIHVNSLSTPKKAMWRMLWANLAKPVEKAIVTLKNSGKLSLATTSSVVNGATVIAGSVNLIDNSGDFSNVFDGSFLKVYKQTNVAASIPQTGPSLANSEIVPSSSNVVEYYRIYKVLAKVNNKHLRLEPTPYTGFNGVYNPKATETVQTESTTFTVKYEVIKILTKDEVVQVKAKTSRSFNDRRVNNITNAKCAMMFKNAQDIDIPETVPGYFLCAALAGLSSNTHPHQPLTRLVLADIYSVEDGRDEYTAEQLSILSTGGGWTMVQDDVGTGVYTWKQRTTFASIGVKEKEYSVTKNVDEISYAIVYDLATIPGRNNNVPAARAKADAQLTTTLDTRTKDVKGMEDSDLGPQILVYSKAGFIQDPNLGDAAFDRINITVPLPLNKLKVGLYVL